MWKVLIVLTVFLVSQSGHAHGQAISVEPLNKEISLELKGRPLKEVAEDIRKQTGCEIVYDDKWKDLAISGLYSGVTIEEFFQRAFRKQNSTLSYNDKGNVVNVRFFSDIIASGAKEVATNFDDLEAVDPVSGIKIVDIKEQREVRKTEIECWRNAPESIDPVSGMKLSEIKEMRAARRTTR